MSELVALGVVDGVATVTLDDPERRNVMSTAMVEQIVSVMDGIEADDAVGAVVVTGRPPAFCAGAELGALGASGSAGGGAGGAVSSIYEGFLRVARCPLPTIAAVNGAAVGAGMNLALACDVRLAGRSAKFVTRFLELGLHPGGGHTWMFRRIAGPQAAAAAVLFGETLDGAEAERVGLAWRCVADEELIPAAQAMAARAAAAPRGVLKRVKETLGAVASIDMHDEAVELELEAQAWSLRQPEFRERLAAMQQRLNKR